MPTGVISAGFKWRYQNHSSLTTELISIDLLVTLQPFLKELTEETEIVFDITEELKGFTSIDPAMISDKSNEKLFPVGIYMFKVININTRTKCEICSEQTIKTPERRH